MILELIIGILTLVAEWMIFKKMGRQGWEGIVPFYNTTCCVRSCTATAGSSFCC